MAVRLFAVGGQEIGPARTHVAGHMLHDDCDAVVFRVELAKQFAIRDLGKRLLGHALVAAKAAAGFLEICCFAIEIHWCAPAIDEKSEVHSQKRKPAHRSTSASLPLLISSATRSKSGARLRSVVKAGEIARIAACAACPRRLVVSGFKKSSACEAASASIARTLRVFATMRFSLSAAAIPMET